MDDRAGDDYVKRGIKGPFPQDVTGLSKTVAFMKIEGWHQGKIIIISKIVIIMIIKKI